MYTASALNKYYNEAKIKNYIWIVRQYNLAEESRGRKQKFTICGMVVLRRK